MALTPNSTLADLPGTTPTAEIDNVANQAQIRAAIGAVGTDLEITTALQGVEADATKIGNEYLPSQIEADGITLLDTSEDILPANTLGRKGDQLVLHDGATAGGVIYYPKDPLISKSSIIFSNADFASADLVYHCVSFPMPASFYAVGQKFKLTGNFSVGATGNRPNYIGIGFNTDFNFGNLGFGVVNGYDLTGSTISAALHEISWLFEWTDAGGGVLELTPLATMGIQSLRTGSTITIAPLNSGDFAAIALVQAVAATAQNLYFDIEIGLDADGEPIVAIWDLKLELVD